MTLDEAIKRFSDNAEYERSHGSLQGCLEFRQLAEWLTELKKLKEQTEPCKIHLTCTDEEIANSFIEDVGAVKDQLEKQPCEDCISRSELLKAIDTWDKFGCDADTKLVQYQDHYIPYIHYDDVVKCIKSMPSVQLEPKKGYISIADVMSVFDDFMCGDVDEDGTETFLEMLKDKVESEDEE